MIYFLMFLGIIFSIVKANGWIIVSSFCIWFCWLVSFITWMVYGYARGISDGIKKELPQIKEDMEKLEKK